MPRLSDRAMQQRRRRSLCIPLVAVFASACATTASSGVSPAGSRTSNGEYARLDARLLAMVDTKGRDTSAVDEALRHSDPTMRARAALAVGQVRLEERYPALRQLLLSADTGVAATAAFALGLARDSNAILALGRAVAGATDVVAAEAAWALGQIGEPAAAVLALAIGNNVPNPLANSTAAQRTGVARSQLLEAVIKVRSVPPSLVVPWLSDTSLDAVRSAAYVVARGRVTQGVRAMLELRGHNDELVRQHVARTLARPVTGDSLASAAREALRTLIGDPSARVRVNAARSLTSFGSAAREDVLRVLADSDANVRIATAEGLGAVFGNDAQAWSQAWNVDTTFTYRRTLLTGARRAGVDVLSEHESAWQRHADWWRRTAAIEARALALAQAPADRKLQELELAYGDSDARVRAQAVGVLASIQQGAANPAVVEKFRAALRDADPQVRAQATRGLSRHGSMADLPLILDAYSLAARDTDPDARQSALRFIAAAWQRDSAGIDNALRARLAALPVSDEPFDRDIVRQVSIMSDWNARGSARSARDMSEYEAISRRYRVPGARRPDAVIHTDHGDINVVLLGDIAPLTVDAFTQLARRGVYRNTRWHRVVPNFVAQDGDPRGDGSGSAGIYIRDEHSRVRHQPGCLGVATSGPDTGGSQFYLCHSPQPHLDGGYTVFGQVTSGLDVLDRIVQGDRVLSIEVR